MQPNPQWAMVAFHLPHLGEVQEYEPLVVGRRNVELLRVGETKSVVPPLQTELRISGNTLEEAVEAGLEINQRLLQAVVRHVPQELGVGL